MKARGRIRYVFGVGQVTAAQKGHVTVSVTVRVHQGSCAPVRNEKQLRVAEQALWTRHRTCVGLEATPFLLTFPWPNICGVARAQRGSSTARADRRVQISWVLCTKLSVPFVPVGK